VEENAAEELVQLVDSEDEG
jgi:AmiR/NasT family two-component response regulator